MKNEKDTKAKLLASAKQEFQEKGYMHASLRSICKKAGVTTGALYFFFQDKEDVFASLVEEPLKKLYQVMNEHFSEEINQAEEGLSGKDVAVDLEASRQIIHYLYEYYDEFQLILTKGQGSKFENMVDHFVAISEVHHRKMADKFTEHTGRDRVDDSMIHWLSHVMVDVFVYTITHEQSEDAAQEHMKAIIEFIISGWFGVLG